MMQLLTRNKWTVAILGAILTASVLGDLSASIPFDPYGLPDYNLHLGRALGFGRDPLVSTAHVGKERLPWGEDSLAGIEILLLGIVCLLVAIYGQMRRAARLPVAQASLLSDAALRHIGSFQRRMMLRQLVLDAVERHGVGTEEATRLAEMLRDPKSRDEARRLLSAIVEADLDDIAAALDNAYDPRPGFTNDEIRSALDEAVASWDHYKAKLDFVA